MNLLPSLQRNNRLCDKGFPNAAKGTPNAEAGKGWKKAMRHLRRSYGHQEQILLHRSLFNKSTDQEMAPVPQQQAEPKTLPREPSFPRTTSLQKTLSIQNLTQTETPWENVTLNRCLFVVITILVLTSGLQRLHETLRGQGTAEEEEEVRLTVRRSGTLRHRGQPPEPETSLWDVMFWWLPDLDDDDDDEEDEDEEDDDGQVKRGRLTKKATARASRGFRNKPIPDKNLLKQRGGELMHRGAKKANDEKSKGNKERDKKDELEAEGDEDRVESEDEEAPRKSNKLEKKKTPKD